MECCKWQKVRQIVTLVSVVELHWVETPKREQPRKVRTGDTERRTCVGCVAQMEASNGIV